MRNKILRISYLSVILVFFVSVCGGFTMTTDAELRHNGKGSAVLHIQSDAPRETFEQTLRTKLNGYNGTSAKNTQTGGDDMLVVRNIEETSDGYAVSVDFRRVDKLEIRGMFEHTRFSSYMENYITEPDPDDDVERSRYNGQQLVKWSRGNLTGTSVDALDYMISFNDRSDVDLTVLPQTAAGESLTVDEFIGRGKRAGRSETILTYYILGAENVTSVELTLPGEILYYGDANATVSGNTIVTTPSRKNAEILATDGTITIAEVGCYIGYVVYAKAISPSAITLIVVGCVLAVGLAVLTFVYFYARGKRALAEEARTIERGER